MIDHEEYEKRYRNLSFAPHANKSYIDWHVDNAFHPVIKDHTEDDVIAAIVKFVAAYKVKSPKWAYPAGPKDSRSNCQKFVEQMRRDLKKNCHIDFL